MPAAYEIPLSGSPQRFAISLPMESSLPGGAQGSYVMTFNYRDAAPEMAGGCGWTIDLFDASGGPILCGVPLVTGADLLGQYAYLNLGGHLIVRSEGIPDAVPTFDNLGSGGHLFWVTLP